MPALLVWLYAKNIKKLYQVSSSLLSLKQPKLNAKDSTTLEEITIPFLQSSNPVHPTAMYKWNHQWGNSKCSTDLMFHHACIRRTAFVCLYLCPHLDPPVEKNLCPLRRPGSSSLYCPSKRPESTQLQVQEWYQSLQFLYTENLLVRPAFSQLSLNCTAES